MVLGRGRRRVYYTFALFNESERTQNMQARASNPGHVCERSTTKPTGPLYLVCYLIKIYYI